jgi:hypothetical protein
VNSVPRRTSAQFQSPLCAENLSAPTEAIAALLLISVVSNRAELCLALSTCFAAASSIPRKLCLRQRTDYLTVSSPEFALSSSAGETPFLISGRFSAGAMSQRLHSVEFGSTLPPGFVNFPAPVSTLHDLRAIERAQLLGSSLSCIFFSAFSTFSYDHSQKFRRASPSWRVLLPCS